MTQQFDVAIVGAGMVGASLALLLDDAMAQGLTVALIDEHEIQLQDAQQPSFDERTTALSFGTQQIFSQLDIWSDLAKQACPIEHIQVSQQGQLGRVRLHAQDERVDALGYVVPNRVIGQTLSRSLLNHPKLTLIAQTKVKQYRSVESGTELVIEQSGSQQSINTRLLVLADGANSQGCAQLGITQQRFDYGQQAIICNITLDKPHQNWAYERFTLGGPLALLPIQGNRFALVWCLPKADAQSYLDLTECEFNAQLQSIIGFDKGRIVSSGERVTYPLVLSQASEQVRHHLVVLGNAAHGLHPVAGQGFNLALRDAKALAQNIMQTIQLHGVDQLGQLKHLLSYVTSQKMDQSLTINMSHHLPTKFTQTGTLWSLIRALGLTALDSLPVAKTLFARQAMGLVGGRQPWQP